MAPLWCLIVLPIVPFIVCLNNVAVKEVPMDAEVLRDECSALTDTIKEHLHYIKQQNLQCIILRNTLFSSISFVLYWPQDSSCKTKENTDITLHNLQP